MSVRPSDVRPTVSKSFHISTKSIGTGRRVIHQGMMYDPIQGQGQGGLKCAKMADFKGCLLRQYACNQKTNGEL